MNKRFLSQSVGIIIFLMSVTFSSCGNSGKMVGMYVDEMNQRCPIILSEEMTITGASYEDGQLTYKVLLNEDIMDMSAIKTEDYKNIVALFMGNKGVFSDELIRNDVSVVYSFKGNRSATVYNVVLSADELRDVVLKENVDIADLYDKLLRYSVNVSKKSLPMDIDRGIEMTDMILSDSSLVAVMEVSEELYDMKSSSMVKDELKKGMKEGLRNSADAQMLRMLRLLINTNRKFVYCYVGDKTGRKINLELTHQDLMYLKLKK